MKIIVTGSKGFIGSYLVPKLISAGHKVIEIDLQYGIDITNWQDIKNIKEFDWIIHLAAVTFVPSSWEKAREMYQVNIQGTLNILELCRINNAKFIFTSSYVYGVPQYLPIDEKHPVFPFNPYCRSKLIGEELCRGYNSDFQVPVIIFRPFNIYGKGQADSFLISTIFKQISENGKITLKDPNPKRDFVHVTDVVEAYCNVLNLSKFDFEIFNLGCGKSYSVQEIVQLIKQNSIKDFDVVYANEKRHNEVADTIADISYAQKILNWEPKVDIVKGLCSLL
ncbi:MAG TPA: NAD(P)-dependent oxidoreductase [bacterium]|nr:NAD(P)-dependent oxidoreductase [bacterium]HPN42139.1 NAD(P)-dependent oxidoreductase [bacterium]